MLNRMLLDCVAKRQFGQAEMEKVIAFFGDDPPKCVFCGAMPVQRWDHLIPVMRGGDTVLGNMVPACAKCDDSKRDLPYEEWMRGGAPGSPTSRCVPDAETRLARVSGYVEHFRYAPKAVAERLEPTELDEYERIRLALSKQRSDVEAFIERYRDARKVN